MITVRKAEERGKTKLGWLDSKHTFSFGHFHDANHMGFGPLRVINDDRVAPGGGFGTHPHDNMEIISYVVEGALEHRDSLGTGSVIQAGDLQIMAAGTGVEHSEFNASKTEPVHFLQIWLLPEARGLTPRYEQKSFASHGAGEKLRLGASRDGRDGSLTVHQDVDLYLGKLQPSDAIRHPLAEGRRAWLQAVRGSVRLGDRVLNEGDGAAVSGENEIVAVAEGPAEFILFDMQ